MPRKSLTPDRALVATVGHASASVAAARAVREGIAANDPAAIMAAAKDLESAGCYIRRACARGLLTTNQEG